MTIEASRAIVQSRVSQRSSTMMRIIFLMLAICVIFGLASGAFADEAADKAFYDAFELLKAKKADAAIVKFDRA